MSKLLIVLGSTRPGRIGLPVALWFTELAVADSRFEVELVDLAELALPLLDEPDHPALHRYTTEHARAWSGIVDAADAIVLVTAEYNWGYPAPLKNALDYLCHEWANKPVGFVSYGGIAAGTRSVQQLRQVTSALRMVTAVNAVHIPVVFNRLDADARFISDTDMQDAGTAMLEELEALDQTLASTRERLAG